MIIVIGWAEKTKIVPNGKMVMRDMNYFPDFDLAWEGKAAIWINDGDEDSLEKAQQYAAKEGHEVFCFPPTENDPLGKARSLATENSIKRYGQ